MSEQGDTRSNFMDYPIGKIIVGIIFVVSAFWLDIIFYELETGVRESFRINWVVALLYNNLGPTLTFIILILVGLAAILFGALQYFRERNA